VGGDPRPCSTVVAARQNGRCRAPPNRTSVAKRSRRQEDLEEEEDDLALTEVHVQASTAEILETAADLESVLDLDGRALDLSPAFRASCTSWKTR
jgi:hypothetical protein